MRLSSRNSAFRRTATTITTTIASQEASTTNSTTNAAVVDTKMGVKPETSQQLVSANNTTAAFNFATGFDSEADIELPDVEKLRQLLPEEGEEGGEQLSQLDIILQAISYIRSLQNNLHTTDRPEER